MKITFYSLSILCIAMNGYGMELAALAANHPDVFNLILNHCIDVHEQPQDAFLSLQGLASTNKFYFFHVPEYFIQQWSKHTQQSPLVIAVAIGYYHGVKRYLQKPHFDQQELWSTTVNQHPLMTALIVNHGPLIKLLSDTMKKEHKPYFSVDFQLANTFFGYLFSTYCEKNPDRFKTIDHYICKIKGEDTWFITPLIYAIIYKYYRIMRYLLSNGADPNGKDSLCNTPLLYAINDIKALTILLEYKANINITNEQNKTPLGIVLEQSSSIAGNHHLYPQYTEIINLLRKYGAQ